MFEFYKIHKVLCFVLILSIAFIVSFEFIFANTDEVFKGGAKLAEITVNLSLSYIAGLIFYILSSYVSAKEQRKRVGKLPVKTTESIFHSLFWFIKAQEGDIGLFTKEKKPDFIAIEKWLNETSVYADSCVSTSSVGVMLTYQQALEDFLVRGILLEIEKVNFISNALEAEFLEALYAIKRASLCERVTKYPARMFQRDESQMLSYYKDSIFELIDNIMQLVKITEKYYGKVHS